MLEALDKIRAEVGQKGDLPRLRAPKFKTLTGQADVLRAIRAEAQQAQKDATAPLLGSSGFSSGLSKAEMQQARVELGFEQEEAADPFVRADMAIGQIRQIAAQARLAPQVQPPHQQLPRRTPQQLVPPKYLGPSPVLSNESNKHTDLYKWIEKSYLPELNKIGENLNFKINNSALEAAVGKTIGSYSALAGKTPKDAALSAAALSAAAAIGAGSIFGVIGSTYYKYLRGKSLPDAGKREEGILEGIVSGLGHPELTNSRSISAGAGVKKPEQPIDYGNYNASRYDPPLFIPEPDRKVKKVRSPAGGTES